MILNEYKYITLPEKTGDIITDTERLFQFNGKSETFNHVRRVANVNAELAEKFALDKNACIIGGYLHDISAVIKPEDMLHYAEENGFELCEAERSFPFLLHQRISGIIAEEYFGIEDSNIISPIECHTTLKSEPTQYEMALFIADKLAWDRDGTPPFYDSVKAALDNSLENACCEYMDYMISNGKILCPHTNWNLAYEWLMCRLNPAAEPKDGLSCT